MRRLQKQTKKKAEKLNMLLAYAGATAGGCSFQQAATGKTRENR
jgi:hypothetical protein